MDQPESTSSVSAGFVRQRRNLILVSMALLFIEYSGAELRAINLLGNSMTIAEPDKVTHAIWILLAYFYLRYYQYFRDLKANPYLISYWSKLDSLIPAIALKKLLPVLENEGVLAGVDAPLQLSISRCDIIEKQPQYFRLNLQFKASRVSGEMRRASAGDISRDGVEVSGSELTLPKIRAALFATLQTHTFTEYLLPFLLPITPVAVALLYWHEGAA